MEDDKTICEELIEITKPEESGPTATLNELFTMLPNLKYNLRGDYSHIEGVRFSPLALLYKPEFLELQGLPPDSLTKLGSWSGIFNEEGVMIRELSDRLDHGTTFGEEVLKASPRYLSTVLAPVGGNVAVFTRQDYEVGLEVAIQAEAERRLSHFMVRVFHDTMPTTITKKVLAAMLRNEIALDKNHGTLCTKPRMFCVMHGTVTIRRKRHSTEMLQPVQEESSALGRTDTSPKNHQPMSHRVKLKDNTKFPSIKANYFDLPVELRLDKRFKNMILRKKQNPIGYETLMTLQSDEIFGLYESITGKPFNYEIYAIEKSSIISISTEEIAKFMNESPYYSKFVKNHVREFGAYNSIAAEEKERVRDFHEKLEERKEYLDKERAMNGPGNSETREMVLATRKCIKEFVGYRRPDNVNIYECHSKYYWDQLDKDHVGMVDEFNRLFQKPEKKLRLKTLNDNPVVKSSKNKNSSMLTAENSSLQSNFGRLNLGPSPNVSILDEVDVSFCVTNERPSVNSQRESMLASKLYQLSRSRGGKSLAQFIASRVTRASSNSSATKNAHARSYDYSARVRKKQLFETVIDRSASQEQEPSIRIRPISAKKMTQLINQPLPKVEKPKSERKPLKSRAKTTKPEVRFEIPLN